MAEESHPPGADVYAPVFIPKVFREVNDGPATVMSCTPVKSIDFSAYVSAFAGSRFLLPDPAPPELVGASDRPIVGDGFAAETDSVGSLTMHNYHAYFRHATVHEATALQRDCDKHALFKHPLLMPVPRDPRPGMASLHVPGLRESGSLRIEVGDIVHLRQLRFDLTGRPVAIPRITNVYGQPRFSDVQHDSVVWAIDRLRELLTLRVEYLTPASMLFNVSFSVQKARIGALYRAIVITQNALLAGTDNWTRSQLFPELSDGKIQTTLNRFRFGLSLHDSVLNYEQIRAVDTILNQQYGCVPHLISGPPGTGKTKTMVELTLQLHLTHHTAHVLLCAPSDSASDTLVSRLQKYLKPSQLLRLNSPARSFPEVPESILPFCFVDEDLFGLPPFEQLMKYRVVVVTCRDAEILLRGRLSNKDLYELEVGVHGMIHPEQPPIRPQLHWTALLCDEAAQSTEPEFLIPLSVAAPPEDFASSGMPLPVLVLAGDQNQLGPRTASKLPAMQTSLFARLLDRPLYRDHPLARSQQSGGVMRPLTQQMLPILRPAFTNLIRNYRSHPAILSIPSSLFYFDTLEPQASNTDALLEWNGWRGRGWPVLFASNTGKDEIEHDGGGWFNVTEAEMACRYAESILRTGLIEAKDVCIMSPFRAQVRRLRLKARNSAFPMHAVNIGPLEAFQGLESRLVILCTTRTRNRFIEQDIANGFGVIHEPQRFNVALTRAKEGLIVIGNPAVLEQDPKWAAFLSFCYRNQLYEPGEQVPIAKPSTGLGRLEKQLIYIEELEAEQQNSRDEDISSGPARKLGSGRTEEDEMWRGLMRAEDDLREADDGAANDDDNDDETDEITEGKILERDGQVGE